MNTIKKTLAIKLLITTIIIGMLIVNYHIIYIDPIQKLCYNNNIVKEEKIINDTVSRSARHAAVNTGAAAIETQPKVAEPNYSQEDLILIASLIECEAGSDWLADEHQQLVAMVALNRVKSDKFPNTLKEVIYQKGQYSSVGTSRWYSTPSDRALKNAKLALEGNVYCPTNVVFQAEFTQGKGIYKSFYNEQTNSTTYFCYGN